MTNTATISLRHPLHGLFEVDSHILTRAMDATKYRSTDLIRVQACGFCGYGEFDIFAGEKTPLDDCTRLEVLIIWIESGNHTF
jgi:hypothetical protein